MELRKGLFKRALSLVLAANMLVSNIPVGVFARNTEEICTHHEVHTADCGYVEAVAEVPCGHICEEAECSHIHDESCGYVAAVEGSLCAFFCEECNAETVAEESTEAASESTEAVDAAETGDETQIAEPSVIHEHEYEAAVTAPTCTEQGYTAYTCACEGSYVDNYVDATGHTYKNGICIVCGEEDYDGLNLNGLNVLCLGDSITAGQGLSTDTRWTNVLASKYNWTLTNKSQGGISLSSYYYTSNGQTDVSIAKKAETLKTMTTKPDVIVVWGGHNDTGYRSSPLGTWDDETTDSFKGALKYIAELADEYAPNATLFVLTPFLLNETPSTLKVPASTADTNWMFVDAIYEGAEKYGWIPINMDLCGITPFTKSGLLLDNIHPNEAGTEKIVEYLSEELACYGEKSKKETIIFNKSTVSVKPGESTTLKGLPSPRSGTGTMTFAWSSSDSSVATVDAGGKITAVAPGTAAITATASNGTSADVTVSVACDHTYTATITAPTCTEQGYTTYTCACGDSYVADLLDAIGEHSYENGVCSGCGAETSTYLQQLPENILGCTNLYDSLVPVKGYYTATKYDTSNGAVISVVIPVEPGDRIAASSFGAVSENKGSVNGIRVTYLLGGKIVTSLSAGDVYNGYTSNGYITVPAGVDTVCVPWWVPGDSNWLTLSQISKDFAIHSAKTVSAQAPTCTEKGYTAGEICEVCSASLGERKEIPPTGHTYSGDTCTVCGMRNLLTNLEGKYVSILGDSISTFKGYSNDATVNTTIGGNGPRYDAGTADTKPGSYCLLESVDQTWWMHFANRSGMKLLVNNSWAGSQVFGGKTSDGRVIPAAYLDRCVNLHDNTLENNPGNTAVCPDVIFVYLGINDYNFNRSEVGTGAVDYAGLVSGDGTYVTPTTFGEAYGIMLHKMRDAYPDAQIFAMTLLPENLYSVNKAAWEQHNAYIRAAAEYHGIPVVDLAENCAITWDNYSGYMIDKIHPTTAGMKLISDCIEAELVSYYRENPPHTHSYESTITAPTCTEKGYTTYTCACGDSYVGNYVDATGHSYENGICTGCGAVQPAPEWEVGTIAYVNGLDRDSTTRLRTADHLKLSDYAAVRIGNGYELVRFVYDENHTMLSGTDWLGSGVGFSVEELRSQYPNGMYFRIAVRATNDRTLTINDLAASGITFYTSSEDVPEQEIGWNQKEVMKVTVNQDGAVYSGKVFCFNGSGTCTVYSLDDKSSLGSFTLDNISALNPHANSVCFSNTFHAPGDQYPLLYVNVYNNYSSAADRMEGTCCVYRLTEDDGQFTTELVQVVRIGFTEDLSLWKSKENNGDVRPYGNFVVDTDKDELYAFVMRDAENSTRFFRFRLPDLDAGVYSAAYGCNVVTLEIGDILSWFDTNYMTYMQGCCYGDGKILSVEGFSSGTLRIIDLETQREVRTEYLADRGLTCEPELICLDNGTLYYAGTDGTLRVLSLDGMHFHNYTAATTAPTCTEKGYTTYTCDCGDSYVGDYVDATGHSYENGICTGCGEKAWEDADSFLLTLTPENYLTISNPDTEKLSCGPGLVAYGDGKFAVAYLADDTNTVETEGSTTIICRLGLFDLRNPEEGTFFDVAAAGQTIGDVTIGDEAPYEPNLLKLNDSELLVLFNIRDTSGNYIYYGARFDTVSNTITAYQPLTLDGKNWVPANIAASYNAIAQTSIGTSGPTGSMVFTSQIIQHEGYYYGYCGGICGGFSGMLVRSSDGINWTSVMAPEAADDMKGVIECGFQFVGDTVYFCMRDISAGVYHCAYNFTTGEQLVKTTKISGLTTSKPAAFIQDGKLYLIVNKATGDDSTVGRRNTALFYQVDPETCRLSLVRQVFCADGCAYHTVVNFGGKNYWCFHTDARRINPYSQGRSNLAFREIPALYEPENGNEDGVLNLNAYSYMYSNGCITGATNIWQTGDGVPNYHYQIPLADFTDYDTVTITANANNKTYLAFFTDWMTQAGTIAYAEGWTEQMILEPGTVRTLSIPEDARYLYILSNNAAGANLLPESVVFSNGNARENFKGKNLSILGDSISTYTGVSNDASVNATLKGGAIYYSAGTQGVYRPDTWWQQTIDALGMKLLVNNSWSGSAVLHTRSGAVGAYVDRCVQLHNAAGEEPDVIAVFLGTNDFSYYQSKLGTADIDYAKLITDNGDGTYAYAAPQTTCEAYAVMLHKMVNRYPDAEVYCMNLLPRRDPDHDGKDVVPAPTQFNGELAKVISHFGCTVVDLENCGITPVPENFDIYITDQRVHPGPLGMDKMTCALIDTMMGKENATFTVTQNLVNVTANASGGIVLAGGSFKSALTPAAGFGALTVTVTMGGKDVTASVYADGVINISAVTGEVVITASAGIDDTPDQYAWEINGNSFVNVVPENTEFVSNALTKKAGSITDGVLKSAYFQLEKPVVLHHNLPWIVEWRAGGTSWSGMLLAGNANSSAEGNSYLFKTTQNTGFIGFGEALSGSYHNYGVALASQGVDLAAEHTYRLENRIAADGSNMVYLLVDGKDYGPMNHYYIGGNNNQGKQVNWLNGRDFCFSYIGTSGHSLNNCKLEYLTVWEGGHEHSYEDGVCTGCGEEDPNAVEPMTLRYDDHYDISGKIVEILDAGTPTSYQVGYGVEENKVPDTAVVTLKDNTLVATGIGTAKMRIDGILYEVTVETAPISLLLLIGQSNMRGSEGNADQSIVCPDGMVYATFGDDRGDAEGVMNVNNATKFAASALTGQYSTINVEGTTEHLSYYPINSLTEAGKGTFGPDSGFAYEWVKQTGEKVWVVNAAHGGSAIASWQPNATNFKEADMLFSACQETLRKEIAAGHFTLSHMGYFWCQGCSDTAMTAQQYVEAYLSMHEGLKSELTFDADSNSGTPDVTLEFGGIIPVRAGHDYYLSYREGVCTDTTDAKYYESFKDLRFNGPRVAQYWMANTPDLPELWNVCNIGEDWVWMPDGTNGVTEYFRSHYENGTVDYTTQVKQSASWYTPTTPKSVHDSIHYNQIGYNEIGRESVRNTLIMLGEIEAPNVETEVEFLGWDGYSEVTMMDAYTEGRSETLVVPKVYPVWKSKEVTYTLTDGLVWDYYDLLVKNDGIGGVLSAEGMSDTVTVTGHTWSEWVTLSEPSAEGPGQQQRVCSHCGKTDSRTVDGVWQIYDLADHLQELPEGICGETNLWPMLPHENVHFTSGKKWGATGTPTTSITIPVEAGDRIYATSWNKAGENGHATSDGIRLTFFDSKGIAQTLGPGESYRLFAANGGYLVAPEGSIAINIVMWYDSEDYEVYILNRDHTYENGICTGCGAEHPNAANFEGKVISILSASTSTFAGWIPEADGFNLEHRPRYPQDNLFNDVESTWWHQLITQLGAKLGINDSWAGSQVLNTQDTNSGDLGPEAAMASLTRIQNLGANGTPDVILFFGGGNDMGRGVTLGSFDPATAPTEVDLAAYKWDNFADAYTAAILRLQHFYPESRIVVMSSYPMPSYVTEAKLNKYGPVIRSICDHYGVEYVSLRDCGVTFDMLPDGIHPNAEGMDYITEAVLEYLLEQDTMTPGENVVYSVKHELTNAKAGKHYYKGISAGKAFEETLTGDELTVTVTMGGRDITASSYRDGKISIPNVTGDVVIAAKAAFNVDGHLQQLPEKVCAGTNLWKVLKPENIYYTATGWGNTTAGTTWSITIPVKEGDRIWATSLGAYPENGSSANGVRVTWFDENGLPETVDRAVVYAEFEKYGYITAPTGAAALNMPMTNNREHYAVYLLNAEHSYSGSNCVICGIASPFFSQWPVVNTDLTHIICYGQSFSNGSDAPVYPDATVDGVYVYGSITDSSKGTALTPFAATGTQHPIISACNSLAQMLKADGVDTDLIAGSYGTGGRTIAQLMSAERQAEIKAEEGYSYDINSSGRYAVFQNSVGAIAKYAADNGQSVSCPAIVYLQGETDQNTDAELGYPENPVRAGYGAGGDKEKYKEYMRRLKEDMQAEVMVAYGQTEKPLFVIYQVSGTYVRTQYSSINMAQIEFAQENEDVILVQTPYFTPHYTGTHHLAVNGYRWLGEYIAKYLRTALVERKKPWPILPGSLECTGEREITIQVQGVQNGLAIDTYTVEDATNGNNLYGFYIMMNGIRYKPQSVAVSGSEIILTMPQSAPALSSAKTVYVYYAGQQAKGTGNIRDNCTDVGFYAYLDDSNDIGTGSNQSVSHSALDANGNSLVGKKYPLYNWLASFCYEIPGAEQKGSANYRWEMQENKLVSVTEEQAVRNDLTLLQGTVENGVLNKVQYSMEKTIALYHDRTWAIEWKAAGNGTSYGGGKVFAAASGNGSYAQYLYQPADSRGMIAWGVSSESRNYGFKLSEFGIDIREEHTYRIENRIADNGENAVYLMVDGAEIGAMNTAYSTKDGSQIAEPKNWANGKNIYLDYLGEATNFLLHNMKLSYIAVWEGDPTHIHSYTAIVTKPTCTEKGYTTYTCECGSSYTGDYVDARGYEWMLEDDAFKILLIGNSFSEDASNAGMPNSQMLDILQAMLGEDVSVTVGLCYSGGKGLNWHATQSEQGNSSYSLRVISSESGAWKSLGSYTSADALTWTNWDVVSLQHYEINTETGKESNAYPDQVDPKFDNLEVATEFMLDYVDRYAPDAAAYFYMHWARAYNPKPNESLATYNKMAAFFPKVLDYTGTESAKRFETIIPVGLSIQNARTTYLATLAYNTTAYADKNLNLITDAQIGLQRDGGHLSFNVGRYIAALTFAETIIPGELRAEGYVLPDIRITESVGKLPKEYTEIAQKAVLAAVNSWNNGNLAVTNIEGYEQDPTGAASETLSALSLNLSCGDTDDLAEQSRAAVLAELPADFVVDAVEINTDAKIAAVTIRYGYTSVTVEMKYTVMPHSYTAVITPPTCTEKGYTTHTCACGDSYVDSYINPRPLNILMIGNSFSWDAADFWYDMQESMTYNAMKSMLADPYDIHLAVMYKGSATLAYHATCAMKNTRNYTYTEIGPQTNYVWTPSSGQNANNGILEHLEERDWDIIVIQSYQHEADGTDPRSTYTGGDKEFEEPDASLGYLLDYFDQHEPGAQVYYYMPWATTKFYGTDGTEAGFKAIAEYSENHIVHMTGTDSGKKLAGIIPVGTGIQNARTTYLDELRYSSGSGSTALLQDPQIGLQYDSQHLSFGIGRYIAGIVVAESLIPQEIRKADYRWPGIKASPSVGAMPSEYTEIAQKAAITALEYPYAVKEFSGYESDLADRICAEIGKADFTAENITDEAALKQHVEKIIADYLKDTGDSESKLAINSYQLENGKIMELDATATIRVGYTTSTAQISVMDGTAHHFGEWNVISLPTEHALGSEQRICSLCGFVQTREVEGSWQKYALADHLQKLPEKFCSGTNLWELLKPESVMINHLGDWVSAGATVYSVTIPVAPGDRIYANSFDQTDTRKGIQVSFIGDYGIVKTTFSSGTYQEFHANGGYLVAPDGAIAVNIPVWNVNDEANTVNILNRDHEETTIVVKPTCTESGYTKIGCTLCEQYTIQDVVPATGHSYESVVTKPTCTEKGYTTHTCTVCGDSYRDNDTPAVDHSYGEWEIVADATCTVPGEKKQICSACGDTKMDVIPAKGHTEVTDQAVAPTCTETGLTEGKHCSVCGEILIAQTVVDAIGHVPNIPAPTEEQDQICTTCGMVLKPSVGHVCGNHLTFRKAVTATCTDAGNVAHYICACGKRYEDAFASKLLTDVVIPAKGHSYESAVTAPTCVEKGYTTHACTACGDSYVDSYVESAGHSFGGWVETKKPTCTETGEERRDCDRCDHFEIREVAAIGHSYTSVVTAPTCTEKGYTTHTCHCGGSYVDSYVEAAGHSYGDWIVTVAPGCTEAGTERRDCSACDQFESRTVSAVGHGYEAIVTAPTCTQWGYTTYTCSCADVYVDHYTDALGHDYSNWYVVKEATLEEEGQERRDCGRCEDFQTRKIPTLEHRYVSVITDPTCTERGYTTHTCSDCGDSYQDTFLDALGHSYKTYVSDRNATCTEDGTKTAVCERCDDSDTMRDAGSATGHSFGSWALTKAPACVESGTEQRSCANCDFVENREVAATGHSYEAVVTAPTCTEKGYTTHACHCGDSYVDSYVEAVGHSFGEWVETRKPACTETGEEYRDCGACDHFETREVAATGHNYEPVVTAPTCTEKGYTTHNCHCGDSYADSYVDAIGHKFGEWETAPNETGKQQRTCSVCGFREVRTVETGNRLILDASELEGQRVVWVDGVEMPVHMDGDMCYVNLPQEDVTNLITYSYYVGDETDVHTQYPVGMQVWMLEKTADGTYTAHRTAELDNLLQYSGSSIRIVGNKGIRMITSINQDTRNALTGNGLAGYTLVEYGTALCRASALEGGNPMVLGYDYVKSNYAYKKDVADPVFKYTADQIQYTNVLVGFTDDDCKEDIAMRPYIILEDSNGQTITLYGGILYRSIGYIAYQNRNAFTVGSDAYAYVWNIIHHVYGDQYDADYKG